MLRDMDASRSLLQAVLERLQQTAQQSAIEAPDAHEISLALPPDHPIFPRTGPIMGAAIAFGVVFGLLMVYLCEIADTSFRTRRRYPVGTWPAVPRFDPARLATDAARLVR